MPRRPDGLTARTEHVTARFTRSVAATLDRLRGTMNRSRYLEHLVIEEGKRQPPKEK